MTRTDDISDQVRICARWSRQYNIWNFTHYVFGIVTVILAVTIAARLPAMTPDDASRELLAWALAVLIGVSIFISPHRRGEKFRRAWSLLATAITIYKMRGSKYSIEDVVAAQIEGESILHEFRMQMPLGAGAGDAHDDTLPADAVPAE